MNADGIWRSFVETGDPVCYLLAKRMEQPRTGAEQERRGAPQSRQGTPRTGAEQPKKKTPRDGESPRPSD